MRRIALAGLVATLAAVAPASPQGVAPAPSPSNAPRKSPTESPPPGPALEPFRFNPRERTARGLAAWEKGRPADAVAPLDSALRLQPGDPIVEYNAGTAHLGANQPDAGQLLEQAAKHAPAGLAADAFYNLGNARLDTKDPAGAIDAYKEALRAQPDQPHAKRNLELALRMLEEQRQQQEQQEKDQQQKNQQSPDQRPDGDQGQGRDQDRQQQRPKPDPEQAKTDPAEPAPQPGDGEPQHGGQQPPTERPLPQFQDQKDMTAEQAAAILQAVENLERQQRRDQARALARAKTSVEKDW